MTSDIDDPECNIILTATPPIFLKVTDIMDFKATVIMLTSGTGLTVARDAAALDRRPLVVFPTTIHCNVPGPTTCETVVTERTVSLKVPSMPTVVTLSFYMLLTDRNGHNHLGQFSTCSFSCSNSLIVSGTIATSAMWPESPRAINS